MKFKSPNDTQIVGILESCPCMANVSDISEDGQDVVYAGGSTMYWDDQKPVLRDGNMVYLDEDGNEWLFSQLTPYSDEEDEE